MNCNDANPAEQLSAEPRAVAPRKLWMFRLVAVGVPSIIGSVVLVILMVRYHFLIVQPGTGRPTIQRPLYLQEPGYETTGHKYLFDERLGWRNIPNWRATTNGRSLTINSKGLRGREYPYEKPDGTTRILVLGDSFTWGYGVGDNEVFTNVLERQLAGSYEVINTGVSGWGTDQEYLFLVNEGLRYSPDIVILAFFLMNDPVENISPRVYEMNKPVFLDERLTLGNVPVRRPHQRPRDRGHEDPMAITLAIMHEMSKVCTMHGCPLVIMKFGRFLRPTSVVLLADEQTVRQKVEGWPDTFYLDLDDAFRDRGFAATELTAGNSDGHWNAMGHRATAEILYEFLHQSQVVIEP